MNNVLLLHQSVLHSSPVWEMFKKRLFAFSVPLRTCRRRKMEGIGPLLLPVRGEAPRAVCEVAFGAVERVDCTSAQALDAQLHVGLQLSFIYSIIAHMACAIFLRILALNPAQSDKDTGLDCLN